MAYIDKTISMKKTLIKFLSTQSELKSFPLAVSFGKCSLFKKNDRYLNEELRLNEYELLGCKIIKSIIKNKSLNKSIFIYTENSLAIKFSLEEKSLTTLYTTKKYNYSIVLNTEKLIGHIECDNSTIHYFDFSRVADIEFNEMIKLLLMAIHQKEVDTLVLK